MTHFEDLDISNGVVLDKEDAIEYIKYLAYDKFKNVMEGDEDIEGIEECLQDLIYMIKDIEASNYEYFKLFEHPMAASGLHYKEMKEV